MAATKMKKLNGFKEKPLSDVYTAESRYFEPLLSETKIGLKNRVVREITG